MADDFDEEEEDVELDDDTVEDEEDLALDDGDDLADDLDEGDDLKVDDEKTKPPAAPRKQAAAGTEAESEDEDDENLDLEDELHPDDVEEPLDVLLAERTAAERLDEDEAELEDEELEPEERAEGGGRIVPRREDEFLCRSCFLVKPRSQLAKGERNLCRDCE